MGKEVNKMESLKVPEEIREIFDDGLAAQNCRDECINSLFKAKRAIYYSKKHLQANRKAWELIFEVWPELKGKYCSYSYRSGLVTIKDDADNPAA